MKDIKASVERCGQNFGCVGVVAVRHSRYIGDPVERVTYSTTRVYPLACAHLAREAADRAADYVRTSPAWHGASSEIHGMDRR